MIKDQEVEPAEVEGFSPAPRTGAVGGGRGRWRGTSPIRRCCRRRRCGRLYPRCRHTAGGGVLPHGPLPAHIAFVGLRRDAAHPVRIIVQLTFEHIPVEGDVRINNRTLAGMHLHLIQHQFDMRERRLARQLHRAGARVAVPFEVEHRGQCVRVVRTLRRNQAACSWAGRHQYMKW